MKTKIHKKVILIIIDGFGVGKDDENNAIFSSKPTTWNLLKKEYPNTELHASEEYVGLPTNQFGNSEIGHLTIGSGKIIKIGLPLINDYIIEKKLETNQTLLNEINNCKKNNHNFHIFGIYSTGGVHGHYQHIHELINICNEHDLIPIVHLFSDGRDTQPNEFIKLYEEFNKFYLKLNKAKLGSISGRYWSMDRNSDFDKTNSLIKLLFKNNNKLSVDQYFDDQISKNNSDEFFEPISFLNEENYLKNDDICFFSNYRNDRIWQLAKQLKNNSFNINLKTLSLVTLKSTDIDNFIINVDIKNKSLGMIIDENNLKQIRIAESEKFPHVTYFFDSLKNVDLNNYQTIKIPSKKVKTYDLFPKMSASEITNEIIKNISDFDFFVVNYANADMVGHSGKLLETKQAISFIDNELKILYNNIVLNDLATLVITSDHGNADIMIDDDNKQVKTHTLNKVPFLITDKTILLIDNKNNSLTNIANTILKLFGIDEDVNKDKALF